MANWTFDPSQYQEQNFALIPVGDHRVRIEDVVERQFKSGNVGFEITLAVNGYNSKLWFYLVLDPSNPKQTNQRLGEFFLSFGITNLTVGNGRQWIGATGAVRVKHEEYNGSMNAKVAYCLNPKNQEKLPAWQGSGGVMAAPTVEISASDLPFDM